MLVRYALRRLAWVVPIVLGASIVAFTIMHAAPGSPWNREGRPLPPELVERLTEELGLDQPLPMQYLAWLGRMLQGDFGISTSTDEGFVADYIGQTLGTTLVLCGLAFLAAVAVGVPLGVFGALSPRRWVRGGASALALLGMAAPAFAIGGFLLAAFPPPYVLPPSPFAPPPDPFSPAGLELTLHEVVYHWVFPVIALAGLPLAVIARHTKGNVLEVLHSDYVRTAHSKGLQEGHIVRRHLLRNALVPLLTTAGTILALLITGSIVVERVFGVDGLGNLYYWSIRSRDYTLLMGITVVYAFVVALVNAVVDITYGLVDPRIRDSALAPAEASTGG